VSTKRGTGLRTSDVVRTWWPLAASWVLMALEGPTLNLVVARLADPKIHLAAYGSLVYPLALLIEAPIIMLLAASTALCRDRGSFERIRRFMHVTGAVLTAVHAAVAFTPLYGLVTRDLLGAPEAIVGPARIGLMIALPWTWAIAYRRFHQGVLIRFGHSVSVGIGTGIRLLADATVLAAGYFLTNLPGTAVAACALIGGVLSEAAYVGLRVRPVLRENFPASGGSATALTMRAFLRFYVPLSLTSIISLGAQPILTAAISRMPNPLESLAAWPVVSGLIFLFRSAGVAYNEVVISLVRQPGSAPTLRRFAGVLAAATTGGMLLIAATPLSRVWFGTITGLSDDLVLLSQAAVWFALLLPAVAAYQSWLQAVILHSERTRAVTEAVLVYLVVVTAVLWVGIAWGRVSGIYVAPVAMTIAEVARNGWLWLRGRAVRLALAARDSDPERAN
jgi:hypothetical protein